jgi:hypothetical protein
LSGKTENAAAIKASSAAIEILFGEITDTALERAAADAWPVAAMSMPNAPTVSILVVCCGTNCE